MILASLKAARAAVAPTVLVAVVVGAMSPQAADAKVVRHFNTQNGYRCHTHSKRVHPRVHYDWTSRVDRHGRSRTHCMRIRHRHHRHHGGGSTAWVLPRYVVMCESGGNARAVNYSNPLRPAGLYQIITPTWLGYGGGRFAATADRASVYHQGVIALRVLHSQGPRAWECW